MSDKIENVIIIGSGPAGWTAGIYTARASLDPLLFTGHEIGGQVSLTYEVENYPGFPDGVSGAELVERFQKQAEKFGTRVVYEYITAVNFKRWPFVVTSETGEEYQAKTVIVATGATARKLQVPGEAEYTGRGVSYCATCDGFFFTGKRVIVVGGGDSAMEEGLFLTRYASEVYVVHRRDQLRASKILQQRAFKNEKMKFIWNTVVEEILGDGMKVTGVRLRNRVTGEVTEFPTDGVFVFIGHDPNTGIFRGQLAMDERGYITINKYQHTSVPGVFAAGEAADHRYRQVSTSVGQGAAAAMEAERFLAELEDKGYRELAREILGEPVPEYMVTGK